MPDTAESIPASEVVLEPLSLNELHRLSLPVLVEKATSTARLRLRPDATRRHIVLDFAKHHLGQGGKVTAMGLLEAVGEQGTLRWPEFGLRPGPDDIFIPVSLMRQYQLKPGLMIHCEVRLAQNNERGLVAASITQIEDIPIGEWRPPTDFDKLTPLFPNRRVFLESAKSPSISTRAVDLVAPLGMGQRGLIVAPPRAGKTLLLKDIARSIRDNHPDAILILLLVDERPEEVTDLRRDLDCEIYSSTFDEISTRHIQVCEAVSERAKRLVELRKDVIILVDSITRMSRGYYNLQTDMDRTMKDGVDTKTLAKPRKFFGSARNVEEGGSLTILATALIETKSRMDDLIFEEFKGTGNMEVHLDRSIAEQRINAVIGG